MLGRRLLMSSGGGSTFTAPPSAGSFALASSPNGGGSNWTLPRAIHLASGHTLVGWVDGSGNIECRTVEDGTGTLGSIATIHASLETDAHNSPAFLRRASDGRILCVYSKHNAVPINLKISTTPDDPTAWGSATDLDSALGGTRYTDYQIHQLASGTIYLIYRDEPSAGTDSRWCYSTSTDGGATWSAQTIFYQVSGQRSYVVSWSDATTIHFIATNGGSTGGGYSGFTALFHFTFDGTTWRQSDGTSMGSPVFDFADATEAYVGTASVFMENIALDADGYPRVAGTDVIGGDPHAIALAWTGSAWVSADLGSVGTGYQYNTGGDFQAYGSCIDVADADRLWVIRDDAGAQPEVFLYRTSDGGASWGGHQVTDGSTGLVAVVCPVRDGVDTLMAFAMNGSWTGYTSWSMGLIGIGR